MLCGNYTTNCILLPIVISPCISFTCLLGVLWKDTGCCTQSKLDWSMLFNSDANSVLHMQENELASQTHLQLTGILGDLWLNALNFASLRKC